jgi:hypothetical protein
MLSLASTTTRNAAFRKRLARRALTSDDAASATLSTSTIEISSRLVISRRAWQSFREKYVPPKPPEGAKPKGDEKPWPRSVKIGGALAGAIFIPYTFLWLVTSNPTLREWLGPYLPMTLLRTHYGHLEWDVQSYSDEMMTTSTTSTDGTYNNSKVVAEYYQFPNEAPYRVRQQQALIGALEGSNVTVTVNLSESDGHQVQETKVVSGSITANEKTLIGLLKCSSKVPVDPSSSTRVAIEFEDDYHSDAHNFDNERFQTMSNTLVMGQSLQEDAQVIPAIENPVAPLLQKTQSFSTWYHVHQPEDQQASGKNSTSSTDTEIELSRLEYLIADLEKNLKDPTCTRDIDEMMAELRRTKRELSALKWRRRLGLKK